METSDWLLILLLATPVLAASYLFFAKYEDGVAKVDSIGDWLINKQNQYANEDSFFSKYIIASLLWPFKKLNNFTQNIEDTSKQSGLRILGFGYYGIALGYLISALIFGLVVLVIALLMLWVVFFVLGEMSKGNNSYEREEVYENDREPKDKEKGIFDKVTKSVKRKDWTGERIEHLDATGKVIGKSVYRKDMLSGERIEHKDADGNYVGKSEYRKDMLSGERIEHKDEMCIRDRL